MFHLIAWFTRLGRRRSGGAVQITVYTRARCHLCDDLLATLNGFRREFQLEIEIIDVDSDPDLATRYGEKIPVLAVGGRPRLWGSVNLVMLLRLLTAEASKHAP